MEIDESKVEQTTLALPYLTLHEQYSAWKSFDWDTMNRLYEKGYISNPVGRAKSVRFTEHGLREAERLFELMFAEG